MTRPRFSDVEEYLASVSREARPILEEIRKLVAARVPGAVETISYQMPAFRLRRIFIYFAAFKKHIGIYPPVEGDERLAADLLPYRGEKGNLKFSLDREMPYELIGRVAEALAREHG